MPPGTTDHPVETHWHPFRSDHDRQQARRFYRRLAEAGLAPTVVDLTDEGVGTVKGTVLREWFPNAGAEELSRMRPKVVELLKSMHQLGICHRDLHAGNVVVGPEDRPLAIDVEWAIEVDPAWPCYDLEGPSTLIPALPEHVDAGGSLAEGVWWGNRGLARWGLITMGDIFDPKPVDPV